MKKFVLKPKNPLPGKVAQYLDRFGHLPSVEAFKFLSNEKLNALTEEALESGEPVEEWKNRKNVRYGTSEDDFYS